MKIVKYQAIIFSIIYGLLPITMMILRLLGLDNNGEVMIFEFYLVTGIISIMIIAIPISVYIQQILNFDKIKNQRNTLWNLMNRLFLIALVLNIISIPTLGLNSVLSIIPSMLISALTIISFAYSNRKLERSNTIVLDEEIN